MLYKEDIVKILKEMDLPLSEYCITFGAALVLHGVKETTGDIDLGWTTNLAELYLRKAPREDIPLRTSNSYVYFNGFVPIAIFVLIIIVNLILVKAKGFIRKQQ